MCIRDRSWARPVHHAHSTPTPTPSSPENAWVTACAGRAGPRRPARRPRTRPRGRQSGPGSAGRRPRTPGPARSTPPGRGHPRWRRRTRSSLRQGRAHRATVAPSSPRTRRRPPRPCLLRRKGPPRSLALLGGELVLGVVHHGVAVPHGDEARQAHPAPAPRRAGAGGRAVRRHGYRPAGLARSTPDRRYRAGPQGAPDGLRLHAGRPPRDVQPQVRAHPQAGRVSGEDPSAGAGTAGEDVGASEATTAPQLRGVRALAGEDFSFADAIGGVRGLVESTVPGLVFVVVYLLSRGLTVALVAASAVAVLAVVVRLVQRTPVTQAFSGLLGVGVGVLWAWWTGRTT